MQTIAVKVEVMDGPVYTHTLAFNFAALML